MPLLATASARFSAILHDLIFSFPSPPGNLTGHEINDTGEAVLMEITNTPGEDKAFAAGVGPLSFAGSGYGITLILMAILLNRIHHIVRRPRIPAQPFPHPPVHSAIWRTRIKLARMLTSSEAPKYLRLPGVLCLGRAWILFSVLTLQVANLWPVELRGGYFGQVVKSFGDWAGDMEMEKACWQVFLSVCAGLVCSALANGLDRGHRRDVGAGFNLFGYSFLLHLYSSPLTHHRPPPAATHGRPDVHALAQIWLSLTELTWLQAVELFESTRGRQLVPTTVCGSLGLVHFVYVLCTSPLKFPSFTFLTHLLALFLSIIIVSTIALKAFTHIFTLGYLPSPVFANLLPHEGLMPHPGEDFGVALLKLGTACMLSSQFGGMRNELASVVHKPGPYVSLSAGTSTVSGSGGFANNITRFDIAQPEEPNRASEYNKEVRAFLWAFGVVVVNFAGSMFLALPGGHIMWSLSRKLWGRRWWYGPRGWRIWRRAAWDWQGAERERRQRLIDGQRRASALSLRTTTAVSTAIELRQPLKARDRASADREREMSVPYDQYLRGEGHIEDDDSVGEEWREDEVQPSDAWSDSSGVDDDRSDGDGDAGDAIGDLVSGPADPDFQPVLLAHLTSASPLTRRGYRALVVPASRSRDLDSAIIDRRAALQPRERDEWDEDRRMSCVVCTIEPRDTILWPCRCLAVCNECRESLAARVTSKDHMCPCCRRRVEGYSRIYVP